MKEFVTTSIESLKASGKQLIKEIEKVSLSDDENTIENVKLLKGYTHQVLWFLLSYVAVEEYILICNWLCKLKEYLCKILKCIWSSQSGSEGKKCCEHLNGTQNKENCICRILYEIICLLVKSIKRLHEHKREIILRKDTTTSADCQCTCDCCPKTGEAKTCTCVEKTKIQEMKGEGFTVSTKSLDNIRSTILIFYGMEKIIGKCKDKICKGKDDKCSCDNKSDNYAECLSLFSVCFNILKDLSSSKDGTLPMAVTWLSNCLRFVDKNVEVDKCPLATDGHYKCRNAKYSTESTCNKTKVDELAEKYKTMIEKAKELNGLKDKNDVQNGVTGCNTAACPTTTECKGEGCKCNNTECNCENTIKSEDNSVFKKLCDMMCCNGESGKGNCNCSNGGKNCQSISSFCAEVGKFTELVKTVIKQNGATTQESQTTTCNCKEKNCESCQTCRFIKLVEEYTGELKEVNECICNKPDLFDAVIDITLDVGFAAFDVITDIFSAIIKYFKNGNSKNGQKTDVTTQVSKLKFYECECCIDKKKTAWCMDTHVMYAIYSRPQVEPVADLREAKGEVNREADGRMDFGGIFFKDISIYMLD